MSKAIIICGPTGSGKSALAMEVASKYNGSIIGADSRQIYRRLDIGTAKPSMEDRKRIPHYMIDIVNVDEDYSAMKFVTEAAEKFELIVAQKRIPIIVGGAGLYVEALTRGIFIGPGKDDAIRSELEISAAENLRELYSELLDIDPETAQGISPSDAIRIVRAMEIYRQTGKAPSRVRTDSAYARIESEFHWIGISQNRDRLYDRIDRRVDKMISDGLLDEIDGLVSDGLGPAIAEKKIVGYYEIINAMNKGGEIAEAIESVKQHSRNYAKRQLTWFRNRTDAAWFDPEESDFPDKVFRRLDENFKRA